MKGCTMWVHVEEAMPKEGEKVWYYFEPVGRHRGTFDGYYVDDDGKEWKNMHMFSCDYGFLTGDVTHWHPDQDELPEVPAGTEAMTPQ